MIVIVFNPNASLNFSKDLRDRMVPTSNASLVKELRNLLLNETKDVTIPFTSVKQTSTENQNDNVSIDTIIEVDVPATLEVEPKRTEEGKENIKSKSSQLVDIHQANVQSDGPSKTNTQDKAAPISSNKRPRSESDSMSSSSSSNTSSTSDSSSSDDNSVSSSSSSAAEDMES